MENESQKIFQKAVLLQLSTSVWSASKTIEAGLMEQLGQSSDWVRGKKYLLNPQMLGSLKTVCHQARNKVGKYSLPFPIQAIQLIPKDYIETIDTILQSQEQKFWKKVSEFESMYEEGREEAKDVLGELFNASDYPINIRRKFKFAWRFLMLDIPNKASILTPEIYEREKEKFETLIQDTRELSMRALREEFATILEEITRKLHSNGDRPKILSNAIFNKLQEFLCDLENRNIFEDEKLSELADQARATIRNVSPYGLKCNHDLKEHIKNEMSSLKNTVEQGIVDIPRRQITLEQPEAA